MKQNRQKIILIIVILFFSIALWFLYAAYYRSGKIMVASISSDGKYLITTDLSKKAILWDISSHKKTILDRNANIYSAYFVKNSDNYMWQHDANNVVIIKNINGQRLKEFNPGFPTYGQVITSDLQHYYASDKDWNIYSGKPDAIKKTSKGFLSFFGSFKLLNFALDDANRFLLTSGSCGAQLEKTSLKEPHGTENLNGVVLWNAQTVIPLNKYIGNVAKTFATISPDGNYVVAGDEEGLGFIWKTYVGKKLFELWSLEFGDELNPSAPYKLIKWNTKGLIKMPKNFFDTNGQYRDDIFAIKFIDPTHYLRFTTYVPNYAILYDVTDPKPSKYIPLKGKISVDYYTRDQSIDTSPAAHILVTGKYHGNGILVFKYDPATKTLKQIWNAV